MSSEAFVKLPTRSRLLSNPGPSNHDVSRKRHAVILFDNGNAPAKQYSSSDVQPWPQQQQQHLSRSMSYPYATAKRTHAHPKLRDENLRLDSYTYGLSITAKAKNSLLGPGGSKNMAQKIISAPRPAGHVRRISVESVESSWTFRPPANSINFPAAPQGPTVAQRYAETMRATRHLKGSPDAFSAGMRFDQQARPAVYQQEFGYESGPFESLREYKMSLGKAQAQEKSRARALSIGAPGRQSKAGPSRVEKICALQDEACAVMLRQRADEHRELVCARPGCRDTVKNVHALIHHLHLHEIDRRGAERKKQKQHEYICPQCNNLFPTRTDLAMRRCHPAYRTHDQHTVTSAGHTQSGGSGRSRSRAHSGHGTN